MSLGIQSNNVRKRAAESDESFVKVPSKDTFVACREISVLNTSKAVITVLELTAQEERHFVAVVN
ncbi:hypothetical protein RO3G_15477 [Rhizopus delemar RA 99-880]|uniref:Uncharacterized protein n=1 Tax=Rhizopus delemar (strain RA 99-880 / ATCC MYA-4621 / FGSC 9543 / NRRL 43880) TaxID=246409 RepID=I1CQN6_RHIO9|nr:hypothetical protein RO3G_15477 [Rhizopus delemar RA 99-880]|eukprot:EIE90766.1 hypothetical protein RO3G_15477 [Rhizopus delemar RA 99-880]